MADVIIDGLAKEFFELIPQIMKNIIKPFEKISKNSISPMQIGVLNLLKHEDAISMTELAAKINTSKQQLTQLTDKLAENNYINRVNDLKDRRSVKISITEGGIGFLEEYKKQALDMIKEKFEKLSVEDTLELQATIRSLSKIMGLLA